MIIKTLIFLLMLTTTAYGLGETPQTIETLKYKYANDYKGIVGWAEENLTYSLTNASIRIPSRLFIKSRKGDCEEFAYLYRDILKSGQRYNPVVVLIMKGEDFPRGHVMCAVVDRGEVVLLSNKNIIYTGCRTLVTVNKLMYPNSTMKIIG